MTPVAARTADGAENTAKRRQILDGARKVFLEQGFDGASVNDIVRETGVSKGTIYAYFPSKERLFETLVFEDRRDQAERLFDGLDPKRPAIDVLKEMGYRFGRMLTSPGQVAYFRMVLAAAAKFPEAGRAFYEAGPRYRIARLTDFVAEKVNQGELQDLRSRDGGHAVPRTDPLRHQQAASVRDRRQDFRCRDRAHRECRDRDLHGGLRRPSLAARISISHSHCRRAERISGAASPLVAPVTPEPGKVPSS